MRKFLEKHRVRVAMVVSCIYLFLLIFYYYLDRYAHSVVYAGGLLLMAFTFLFIVVTLILMVLLLPFGRRWRDRSFFIAIGIYAIPLLYTFAPFRIPVGPSEKNVVLRACYEGTQNQANLKFYKDSSFVLHWTGVFGYTEYFSGSYSSRHDTLLLKYETPKPFRFGEKILNDGHSLVTLDSPLLTDQYFAPFYLGYCLGLN